MIKVLHLFTTLGGGGVESFLYNYYVHMGEKNIRFDAIVSGSENGYMEPMFQKLGGKVYHIKRLRENPLEHWESIAKIIKNGNYDIVHCHGYKSTVGLIFAKLFNCQIRIIHSHMAYVKESKIEFLYRKILTIVAKKFATDWFACGIDAAKWFFGDEAYKAGRVTIVDNAIDLTKYAFNEEKRIEVRKKLEIDDALVIGNIGRLTYQKNQKFLLEVMKELLNIIPNTKLVLIGEGEDRVELENQARKLKIENSVLFLGLRKDVPDLLSAMDIFVLPSRYEGLPVILAEVQASGLVCCVADSVTREIDVTNLLHYMSLEKGVAYWAKEICLLSRAKEKNRNQVIDQMAKGKYDITYQADQLYEKYIIMLKNVRIKK